jgi:hypothetical protein
MYVNGKMRPVETIPGMGGGIKENDGRGKFKYDIFEKNFCKCNNVPLPSATIKNIKKLTYK